MNIKWNKQNYGSRLWSFKFTLNRLNVIGGSYIYLYPFGYLVQKSFHGNFHMPIIWKPFLKTFLKYKWIAINYKWSISQLQMNYESIINKIQVNNGWISSNIYEK